jgi:hypothetical protein
MSDTAPDATTLALKFRAEGEALHKAAAQERAAAEAAHAMAERRHRDCAELEANVSRRERRLKEELNEPALLERERIAEAKLAEAKALMADYKKDWHAGVIAFQQINEREKRERSEP